MFPVTKEVTCGVREQDLGNLGLGNTKRGIYPTGHKGASGWRREWKYW